MAISRCQLTSGIMIEKFKIHHSTFIIPLGTTILD